MRLQCHDLVDRSENPCHSVALISLKSLIHHGYNLTLSSLIHILYCTIYNHAHILIRVLSARYISRDSITGKLKAF
jgi:hypothetical protein